MVPPGGVGPALDHAAVHQEAGLCRFHQKTGAGDLPCPAEEAYFHDASHPPPSALSNATSCRSDEHTSELQSLMRISYAVLCLKNNHRSIQYSHTISSISIIPLRHHST